MEGNIMKSKLIEIVKVTGCARCGKTHKNLKFKPFDKKFRDFTHWVLCPNSLDPILLKIVTTPD
jgi:hypothetical protein